MNLKNNIPLIYVIGSLMWMRFFIPVLALFYIASKVPLEQFMLIMGVFSAAIFLFEIPSGVVADILGKKKTLLLSRFMYIIEIFLIAFYDGFWVFLIAKIISGIGVSLSSGADSALLYDTLKKLGREKEHAKISGNLHTVTNISMAFVFIIGAYLFSISPKLPAIVSLPLITAGFILTFFLVEPYHSKKKLTMKNSWNHLKEGLIEFKKNDYVKWLVFFSLPVATFVNIFYSISSAYLEAVLIPVSLIGVIAFISSMVAAYMSKNAHKLENKIGDKKSLLLIQMLTISATISMSFMIPYIGAFFYLLVPFVAGLFMVLINHYMNEHISTTHRATLLSIKNFGNNIGMTIMFPAFVYFNFQW